MVAHGLLGVVQQAKKLSLLDEDFSIILLITKLKIEQQAYICDVRCSLFEQKMVSAWHISS